MDLGLSTRTLLFAPLPFLHAEIHVIWGKQDTARLELTSKNGEDEAQSLLKEYNLNHTYECLHNLRYIP